MPPREFVRYHIVADFCHENVSLVETDGIAEAARLFGTWEGGRGFERYVSDSPSAAYTHYRLFGSHLGVCP